MGAYDPTQWDMIVFEALKREKLNDESIGMAGVYAYLVGTTTARVITDTVSNEESFSKEDVKSTLTVVATDDDEIHVV